MARKVKLGTIKITRTVTVKQQVQHQRQVNFESAYEPYTKVLGTPSSYQIENETKKLATAVKSSFRPTKLPSGVYPAQVETLYDELNKRSKTEEQEKNALYDVFISHASEDKIPFVNYLVEALQDAGISVWYDAISMEWGKSLREQIDNGIKRSKYAILVLSKNFFSKKWTNRELDGILAKEEITGSVPLPIWYDITYEEVFEFSPTLSGLYSLSTDKYSIEDICRSLKLILSKEEIVNP